MQALRVAAEAVAEEQRNLLRQGAFVGWQLIGAVAASQGNASKVPAFDTYLTRMGLGETRETTAAAIEQDKLRARENMQRARERFAAKRKRRPT